MKQLYFSHTATYRAESITQLGLIKQTLVLVGPTCTYASTHCDRRLTRTQVQYHDDDLDDALIPGSRYTLLCKVMQCVTLLRPRKLYKHAKVDKFIIYYVYCSTMLLSKRFISTIGAIQPACPIGSNQSAQSIQRDLPE